MKNSRIHFYIPLFIMLLGFPLAALAEIAAARTEPANPFIDVPPESSYFIPVKFLKEKGFITGYADGSFQAEKPVNRAEALAMILKVAGIKTEKQAKNTDNEETINTTSPLQINLPANTTITIKNLTTGEETTYMDIKNLDITHGTLKLSEGKEIRTEIQMRPFRDVSEKDWFYDVVTAGKKHGTVKGFLNGRYFKPEDIVNLAETLRMLFQSTATPVAENDNPLPPGIAADAWYAKDIGYAANKNILMQRAGGEIFPPHEKLNRGQLALILYRFMQSKNNVLFGYASWYGDGLAKTKLTENADYADRHFTAAHKTLPFGTILKVTNMNNGKQVDVVVNDRGPFVTGRIVDLSKSAFSALESVSAGVISVQVEVVAPPAH